MYVVLEKEKDLAKACGKAKRDHTNKRDHTYSSGTCPIHESRSHCPPVHESSITLSLSTSTSDLHFSFLIKTSIASRCSNATRNPRVTGG